MPSVSAKQARLMAGAAHDPKFAKKVGVPVKVAKEFNAADTGTGIIKPKAKSPGHRGRKMVQYTGR
jgi:hypothetical protein